MELALNLAWFTLASLMFWLWLSRPPSPTTSRGMQLVALSLVVIILLPVISVTDDLMAAQKPAEVDTSVSLRRGHDGLAPHAIFPSALAIFLPLFSFLPQNPLRVVSELRATFAVREPALSSIENRPPPGV